MRGSWTVACGPLHALYPAGRVRPSRSAARPTGQAKAVVCLRAAAHALHGATVAL